MDKVAQEANKPKFVLKDHLTLGISLVALITSVSSAYFNYFYQNDDVRIVFNTSPPLVMPRLDKLGSDVLAVAQNVTLINAGNRTASVTDMSLVVALSSSSKIKPKPKCESIVLIASYNSEPIVLKAGEAVNVRLEPNFSPINEIKFEHGKSFVTCLTLTVVTPASVRFREVVPLMVTNSTSGDFESTSLLMLVDPKIPIKLLDPTFEQGALFPDWPPAKPHKR